MFAVLYVAEVMLLSMGLSGTPLWIFGSLQGITSPSSCMMKKLLETSSRSLKMSRCFSFRAPEIIVMLKSKSSIRHFPDVINGGSVFAGTFLNS